MVTLVIALFIAYLLFFNGSSGDGKTWHLDSAGLLAFDAPSAGECHVRTRSRPRQNGRWRTYLMIASAMDVHALLRIPKNVSRPPVVIVLPGGQLSTRKPTQAWQKRLCSWGYATLTLDERGNNGETPGPVGPWT